jgi:hypothetical protein
VNNGLKHQLLIAAKVLEYASDKKPHSYKTGHWDGMMSDEIPSKTLTVIISLATCYQGLQ